MRGFKYILTMLALCLSVGMWGQYNPSNPAEPGAPVKEYTLTLQADPSGGGSFNLNATSNHQEGETFWVQANKASNFTFVEWTLDGEVISTSYRFQYTMPNHDVKLIAHYSYTPSNPSEPSEPDIPAKPVYSNLWLTAQPTGGGSFNISSGTSYEVGTSVKVQANAASNFTFVNWTLDEEVISESRTFNYVMLQGADANRLVAHFTYTPGSPGEPAEPEAKKIYHRVYLMADPAGGGYFNTESGNQFEEGTQQTFRASNNQWYTFQNWTRDGEVVSTNSNYTLTIPTEDVTLVAHYSYNYNPGNPGEPGQPTDKHLSVYGMTASGAKSQTVLYPIFLENTEDVYGVTVVVHFPEGFTPNTANAVQSERAAGHTLTVEDIGNNAYRFDLTGTTPLTGQNGKIFEVPVAIGTDIEANSSYQLALSNAARINLDNSKEMINTRDGYIFVEEMKEDGLYAQYAYEKLQGRVKFNNLSSDKALSYSWDFGDGTTSTEENPLHTYSQSGYYDVVLTVHGQSGTDAAGMTVLINDESTWKVDGTFFLDTEERGVRYFTTAQDLFAFMDARPISGNLKLIVKNGETFSLALTEDDISTLTSIQQKLADGGYTLTIEAGTPDGEPTTSATALSFGTAGSAINTEVVSLFTALGRQMVCDDVQILLWGIGFNPSKLPAIEEGQAVLSGQPTEAVDLTPVSTELSFSWTATIDVETAAGYEAEGTGNIPSMTVVSGSANDAHLVYNIVATYGSETFLETTHAITLRPALEGTFTDLLPADGARLETTTVALSWNKINNAVYDVYLWNAANQRPTTPVAEGITDLSFTSRNFCQDQTSYKWQVVARNALQQLPSDTMHFTIRMLPDLHVTAVHAMGGDAQAPIELEAGRKATIEWTVRNDGTGSTGNREWIDRVWLVSDVYGGTNQSSCKLLATVPSVRTLATGQQYTNSVEVTLDDQSYGAYYLIVASDMSSVTGIEWSSVGGTIVNPYEPVLGGNTDEGTYDYMYATTNSNGNQLEEHGETSTHSDNFFYQKIEIAMPTMEQEDWDILMSAYQQMGSGEGWTTDWDFDVERHTVLTLPGVSILGGHVTSINLSNCNLTGDFPTELLNLPQLRSLNVSGNQLVGDLGQLSIPTETSLQSLNISNNGFEGNIGTFAAKLPNLITLFAEKNQFNEVTPVISSAVTSLSLGSQELSTVLSLDLTAESFSELFESIPNILLYNHKSQSYDNSLSMTATASDGWEATVAISADGVTFAKKSERNDYHGNSGDELAITTASGDTKGSTLGMKLYFGQGDANFNGNADVVDLQAQINFAFESYQDKPFNFTASNLWVDDVINVQDVVKMVDLLLNLDDEAAGARFAKMPSKTVASMVNGQSSMVNGQSSNEASVSIRDGQLWIDTEIPVSAFELTLRTQGPTLVNSELKSSGFNCRTNSKNGITRLVGYSLNGASLPVGTTAICQIDESQTDIVNAVLSDADANEILVRLMSGEETTGVVSIDNGKWIIDNEAGAWYDLQGRKVNGQSSMVNGQLKKGLYIVNGRKIVKK